MKANGTHKFNIAGKSGEITIKNKEAEVLIQGGHRNGGTCEDVEDILRLIANGIKTALLLDKDS